MKGGRDGYIDKALQFFRDVHIVGYWILAVSIFDFILVFKFARLAERFLGADIKSRSIVNNAV